MFAHIAINIPLRTLFTYHVPDELVPLIKKGSRVVVPFGKKKVVGICCDLKKTCEPFKTNDAKKNTPKDVKDVLEVVSEIISTPTETLVDTTYLDWLAFAADYYCHPIGQVITQAFPSHYLDVKKISKKIRAPKIKIAPAHSFTTKSVTLTPDQKEIAEDISSHLNTYHPVLLRGVTGSGKTEIYIHLIKEVLKQKKSALFLVPEIGLTPQMLARLAHHFDKQLLPYHSGLTPSQKLHNWNACLTGEPLVLIGTRSAVFAPFHNLGLIIVDEEHDSSYKQDDRFRYHARDLAVSRAQRTLIPIILGSATPSLESFFLAQQKKYHFFEMLDRAQKTEMPQIRVVDFGKEREQKQHHLLLSQTLHDAINTHYKLREQMIVFVGQRGFAQNAFCVECKKIETCPNCSVGLKFHKQKNTLKCHYCDFERPFDEVCSACSKKALTLLGFGIQSVEDEIRTLHPTLKVTRLDSDVATSVKKLNEILNDFAAKKINLLIGTHMVTKGHDFDNVGFVGVVAIDSHLGLPDFRASERAFQNLVQVAGRSGRAEKRGSVIVQTLNPEHAAIQLGIHHDYQKFAEQELEVRRALNYPPFTRLVQLRFLSNNESTLKSFFKDWRAFLKSLKAHTAKQGVHILGPAEMSLAKLRGKYRYHMCLKVPRGTKFQGLVNYILADLEQRKPMGIQWQVDVDVVGVM